MRLNRRKAQLAVAIAIFVFSAVLSYLSVTEEGTPGGVNICLTIDVSGSMNDVAGNTTKISAAKKAASQFVSILSQGRSKNYQVAIVSFSSNVKIVSGITSNEPELLSAIQSLVAWGSTALGDAIIAAVDLLSSQGGNLDVVLMTDGKSTAGTILPHIAADYAARHDVVVHTVGFGKDADTATLQNIKNITGGRYYFAASGSELVDIYRAIAQSYVSPILHYGSRILILIALPLILFLPEIEKGATKVYKTILSTVLKRPQELPPQLGIRCPECGRLNRPTAKFCGTCKTALTELRNLCPRCGKTNRIGARFCAECGARLKGPNTHD